MTIIPTARHAVRSISPVGSARRTRTLLRAGALTVGFVGAVGASVAGLIYEAKTASTQIRNAARTGAIDDGTLADGAVFNWEDDPPRGDGVYLPDGRGPVDEWPDATRVLTMLGDSLSVGYGCVSAAELPGVGLAKGAAAALDRPVRLTTHGSPGATTEDLPRQLDHALADGPDVAVIIVGANDVRHEVSMGRSATQLAHVVARLRAHGIGVVMASCPDLGTIMPMHQPLRRLAGLWSRRLARAQEKVTDRAGGIAVSLSKLVSPAFYTQPDLFYVDHFHPSGLGYARAVEVLQPAVNELMRD